MSALPRPDLPPGPHRELVVALHDLHHRAGWPSLRTLAREAGVSHTTVSKVFSSTALPAWGVLELVIEAMRGDVADFHWLWLAASTPTDDSALPAAPIAGRKDELAAVQRHLETGIGLLLVTGEAGIGKTTLVTTAAQTTDSFVATGHCLPLSSEVPLLPIADCLRSIHDVDPGWFDDALAACPAYVPAALSSLVPDATPMTEPVRTDDRQLLFSATSDLIRKLAEGRRLAMLVEDLHWADPATLDLLEHLLGRPTPVLVVGSWRTGDEATPESGVEWYDRVRRLADTTVVGLGPLTREETGEQLRLLGADVRNRLAGIHQRSQGQPLFTAQLAAHVDDEQMPELLADLLDRRLAGLTDQGWAVLRTLGVAERPLPPGVLSVAAGISADDLTSQLRELQSRRLLRADGGAVDLQHPLLAEAVRRRMVAGEDTAAHTALAEALGTGPGAEAGEVAEHWRRAGAPESEIGWRIAAARAAELRFDRRTEADHYLRAIDIWPEDVEAVGAPPAALADVYLMAMDALRFSFRFDEAAALSAASEERLGDVDDGLRADLLLRRSIYRGEVEGIEVGTALLDEALALCRLLPIRETLVRALDRKQNVLFTLGRVEEARTVAGQQVEAAAELGNPVFLRDALMRVAWHRGVAGHPSEAMDLLADAAARSGAHQDPLGDVRLGVYGTDVLLICGAPVDAVAAAGALALATAHEHGLDNPQIMLVRVNIAVALLRSGRVADAERLVDMPPSAPLEVDRWPLHSIVATIESRRGHHDVALERIDAIWAALSDGAGLNFELLTDTGDIACWAGKPAPVLLRLVDALVVLAGSSPVRTVAPALVAAARAVADVGDQQQADLLTELAGLAGLLDDQYRGDIHLAAHRATLDAELARAKGHGRTAGWVEAASLWDWLTRPHDAAYCRWRAAQCALRDRQGTIAARLLKRAAADAHEHVPLSRAIAATAGPG
ncbi:MAG TPA: AAA family ATPase [Nocardioides sp.]|nr:AAA family ATPase [Nocardioides sp.]